MPSRATTDATRRLVIVESPTKARTIRRFLPSEYEVMASMGHVRDLPASADDIPAALRGQAWARLGIRVDEGFEPLYVVTRPAVVRDLKRALNDADELLIATDEDREGESIGWHLVEVLEPTVPVKRMVFHEITKSAIERALEDTRAIDQDLVEAQETRRMLDRLVGYTISPLLWRRIAPRLSAGRVQSVAVRILVQRERERMEFVSSTYWDLSTVLRHDDASFSATLSHVSGVRVASGKDFDADTGALAKHLRPGTDVVLLDEASAHAHVEALEGSSFRVNDLESRDATRNPSPPFTTSTLQQEASRKLGWSARDTMRVAQGLYERGLITYMRTDSTHLSGEAIHAARTRVESLYGSAYLFQRVRQYKSNARNAQEAHEAIRPAGSEMRTVAEANLTGRDAALYDLIWKRTIATQMAEARLTFVTARIEAASGDAMLTFRASGRTVTFPGFFRAYVEGSDDPDAALDDRDQPLPPLAVDDLLEPASIEAVGHETKPPARFTEASLVKFLESEGIGRPSTYASIIDTIVARKYVRKNGTQLLPTFTAFATNNLLERQFERLVDVQFTATMEARLDQVADGTLDATPYLREFYEGVEASVASGLDSIDPREISTIASPTWDPYVVRVGRYGPYVDAVVEGTSYRQSISEELAPGDVTRAMLDEIVAHQIRGDVRVGEDAEGTVILLKNGPYGAYVQLGTDDQEGRPKRTSLPPGVSPEDVDENLARRLIELPRLVGLHPDTQDRIEAGIGRYGPYVKMGRTFASLKPEDDVLEVQLERALELLAARRGRRGAEPIRELGAHPSDGEPVGLYAGRFGPYVKHGKINASLPRDADPDTVTLDEAVALLAARAAKAGQRRTSRTSRASSSTASSSNRSARSTTSSSKGNARARNGRTSTKGRAKASTPRPKATHADLEPFLHLLDETDREIVVAVEGMQGRQPRELASVAEDLGLPVDDAAARHKKGLFKLRVAFGRARAAS